MTGGSPAEADGVIAGTPGAALDKLRGVVSEQVSLWRRLLRTTLEGTRALDSHDPRAFEDALSRQIETLRALQALDGERGRLVRAVGEGAAGGNAREDGRTGCRPSA